MAELDDRYVAKAKKLVFEKFPEMDGTRPSVSKGVPQGQVLAGRTGRSRSPAKPRAGHRGETVRTQGCGSGRWTRYVITFERDVPLPGGGKMKRLVRVTMDDAGKVLKLASSR